MKKLIHVYSDGELRGDWMVEHRDLSRSFKIDFDLALEHYRDKDEWDITDVRAELEVVGWTIEDIEANWVEY